jgi:hypothetical protein
MITLTAQADYGHSGQYIARLTGRDPKFTFQRTFIGHKGSKRNETSTVDVDEPGLYECCDISRKHGKEPRYVLVVDIDDDLVDLPSDKEDALKIARALESRPFADIVVGHYAHIDARTAYQHLQECRKLRVVEGSPDWIGRLNSEVTLKCAVGDWTAGSTLTLAKLQPALETEMARLEDLLANLEAQGKYPQTGYQILSAREAEQRQAAATIEEAVTQCRQILADLPAPTIKKVLAALKKQLLSP